MRILATHDGILVGDNQPYSGKLEYGYSVRVHGEGHDLPNVLLEVRDDLIRTEEAIGRWAGARGRCAGPGARRAGHLRCVAGVSPALTGDALPLTSF